MLTIKETAKEEPIDCPYLGDRTACNEAFLAHALSDSELDEYLQEGWRKFGVYFFRPQCPGCQLCLPLRVAAQDFEPSKSQRRVWRKNSDLDVTIGPLNYRRELFDLYQKHSLERFDQEVTEKEFQMGHFLPSCRSYQMEYFEGDKLVALGFIDLSQDAVNSVYFVFDPEQRKRSLGIYGCLQEMAMAKYWRKKFYYLGYWVPGNRPMDYKAQFKPCEYYDWKQKQWSDFNKNEWIQEV